jgi:creatinine amidohydrolase
MSAYTSHLPHEVRLERLRPDEIDAARSRLAAIYVPFGSVEFHGRQNPVGLDALRVHEQAVALALRAGGLVYPPIFFGTGGGHGDYPHSFMFDPAPLRQLTTRLLHLFERDGFKSVILFAGHAPDLWDYLQPALADYHAAGGTLRTLALLESQVPGIRMDHAAQYETSYMLYLYPELVDLSRIAGHDHDSSPAHENRNWMGDRFQSHPCWGLVGPDPRGNSSAAEGQQFVETLLSALSRWVQGEDIPLVFQ